MLTFEWLVGNDSLGLTQLLAPPAPGFAVAQTNELKEPGSFIQPDSLVLTVGAGFKDNEEDLASYIAHLAESGAVAVGFGISSVFGEIPASVVEAARECDIGLYEVSRPVPFVKIVSAVHEEQRRRALALQQLHAQEQQKLLQAQEKLTRTAITGDLVALTAAAAEALHAHVLIKDQVSKVLASVLPPSFQDDERTYFSSYRITEIAYQVYTVEVTSTSSISDEARSLIRHFAGLAATLLARPAQLRRAHNQLNSFALRIKLGLGDDTQLFADTVDAPTDADGFTRPIVIAARSQRAMTAALSTLDRAAHERNALLHALHVSESKFLLVVRPEITLARVIELLGDHASRLRIATGSPVLLDALGPEHVNHLVARTRTLKPGEAIATSETALPWLREPAVTRALAARRRELFGRLNSYDTVHGSDYEKTLAVYLRNAGQLAHTADALGIHRHTVRTRLEKIQRLCEIDLDNPAQFSEAYLTMIADDDSPFE